MVSGKKARLYSGQHNGRQITLTGRSHWQALSGSRTADLELSLAEYITSLPTACIPLRYNPRWELQSILQSGDCTLYMYRRLVAKQCISPGLQCRAASSAVHIVIPHVIIAWRNSQAMHMRGERKEWIVGARTWQSLLLFAVVWLD